MSGGGEFLTQKVLILVPPKRILEKHGVDKNKSDFIIELLSLVLKFNIFEFDGKLFQQCIGTAMGCKPAPDYANIFMATIDKQIVDLALQKTFQNLVATRFGECLRHFSTTDKTFR